MLVITTSNPNLFLIYILHYCCPIGPSGLGHYQLINPFRAIPTQATCIFINAAIAIKIVSPKGKIVSPQSIDQLPIFSSSKLIPQYIQRRGNSLPKGYSFKSLLIVTSLL
jgi:hypothetical protein